jgi:hypothetical protein
MKDSRRARSRGSGSEIPVDSHEQVIEAALTGEVRRSLARRARALYVNLAPSLLRAWWFLSPTRGSLLHQALDDADG